MINNFIPLLLFFLISVHLEAQPGFPDTSFGTAGLVTASGEVIRIVETPDQKLQTSWMQVGLAGQQLYILNQFNADGTIDPSYGNDGVAIPDVNPMDYFVLNDADIQSTGRSLLMGVEEGLNGDFIVLGLTPFGELDSGFGSAGVARVALAGYSFDGFATVDEQDRILWTCVNYSIFGEGRWVVGRLLPNGDTDLDFGQNGLLYFELFFGNPTEVASASDGRIYLVGRNQSTTPDNNEPSLVLVSLEENGAVNSAFGTAGVASIQTIFEDPTFYDFSLGGDGSIYVAGVEDPADGAPDFSFLLKVNSSGEIDELFGNGGYYIYSDTELSIYFLSMLTQPDGKILVGGEQVANSSANYILLQLDAGGNLDPTFGIDGVTVSNIQNGVLTISDLILDQSNRIVSAGRYSENGIDGFNISRFNSGLFSIVQSPSELLEISVYPNPTADFIYLNGQPTLSNLEIELVSISGQTLFSFDESSMEFFDSYLRLKVPALKSGTYLLNIKAGKAIYCEKIFIKG